MYFLCIRFIFSFSNFHISISDITSRHDFDTLGLRKWYFENGIGVRTRWSRLQHLRLGKTTMEPPENCASRRYRSHRIFIDLEPGGHGTGRPSQQIRAAASRLCFCHFRRGISWSGIGEGDNDRLLRPRPRGWSQEHLQEIRPTGLRLLYRPHVWIESSGQSTDLLTLSPRP